VQSYPATTQPLHGSNTSAHSYNPADSPQSASTVTIGSDDILRRKSVILPSLQIPPSINKSGGSSGEFAAQV
jgi:hypothetical protein